MECECCGTGVELRVVRWCGCGGVVFDGEDFDGDGRGDPAMANVDHVDGGFAETGAVVVVS